MEEVGCLMSEVGSPKSEVGKHLNLTLELELCHLFDFQPKTGQPKAQMYINEKNLLKNCNRFEILRLYQ